MVDVRRNNRSTAGDFLADELGGDFLRDARTEAVAGVLGVEQAGGAGLLQLEVLADGDVFHLRGDDALARVVHLADVLAGLGPARVAHMGEAHLGQLGIDQAFLAEVRGQAVEQFGVATVIDPGRAHVTQALAHIDGHVRVGVGAGGVVDQHRGVDLATELGRGDVETDLAHRYANVRARALHIDLLRTRERLDRLLVDLSGITEIRGVEVFFLCAHRLVLSWDEMSERTWDGERTGCTASGAESTRRGKGEAILFPTQALT
ncbi:hypothetical protein D3C85_731270 [compost metagenome]